MLVGNVCSKWLCVVVFIFFLLTGFVHRIYCRPKPHLPPCEEQISTVAYYAPGE